MNPIEKIGAYDLIVTLIPGLILAEALRTAGVPIVSSEALAAYGVTSYILGLLASRAGSLLVSKIAKRFRSGPSETDWYGTFVAAEKADPKIQTLVQVANGYRSLCGGVVVYFGVLASWGIAEAIGLKDPLRMHLAVAALGILFFVSYVKQNNYISERTKANKGG
ncbi:hypothetical protein K3152_09790 [Qipengyuania sp. 1NDH17]|uniref:Uncharacterized protein n=1 Tax=Qipengyuania polymorpha TaxID=2867234 RepID=A0ABS7IYA2_9SPHN|nr:hypothetical protein [Qipengyuania polymorpha]MBX7458536.1 hypothetical protein [Qipengyuania polymorpha]